MPHKYIGNCWILSVIILWGCAQPPKYVKKQEEISKVELATGGCFGACQYTATSIDSSLRFKYFGGAFLFPLPGNERPKGTYDGYYEGIVSRKFWDTLNQKLRAINYKQLDSAYHHSVDDERLELIIHYGDKIKHINAQSASLPDSVYKVFSWIEDSYKHMKLSRAKDSLIFETHVQKHFGN